MKKKIGLIGGGNMGSAVLAGIHRNFARDLVLLQWDTDVVVCEQDKSRCRLLKRRYACRIVDLAGLVGHADVIILAVKPQSMDEVLKSIAGYLNSRTGRRGSLLFISIAAGIKTSYLEKRLGSKSKIIRAMPNLPAQVGQGITAVCAGTKSSQADLNIARRIFDCIGESVIVREKDMDAVTAVSGSGPAYVFYFTEILTKAARGLGLKDDLSRALIFQTLKGSIAQLEGSRDDAAVLREKVTSKGGTTQAALEVLNRQKVDKIFQQALSAAKTRAKELSL